MFGGRFVLLESGLSSWFGMTAVLLLIHRRKCSRALGWYVRKGFPGLPPSWLKGVLSTHRLPSWWGVLNMDLHDVSAAHTQVSLGPLQSVFDNKINEWKLLWKESLILFFHGNCSKIPSMHQEKYEQSIPAVAVVRLSSSVVVFILKVLCKCWL